MQASTHIWLTIFGFISLSIVMSLVTHLWIRHHLKHKNTHPQKKKLKNLEKTLDAANQNLYYTHHFDINGESGRGYL